MILGQQWLRFVTVEVSNQVLKEAVHSIGYFQDVHYSRHNLSNQEEKASCPGNTLTNLWNTLRKIIFNWIRCCVHYEYLGLSDGKTGNSVKTCIIVSLALWSYQIIHDIIDIFAETSISDEVKLQCLVYFHKYRTTGFCLGVWLIYGFAN